MENSFEEAQRVCCFNHTLQLSSKAILKPFGLKTSGDANEDLSIDAEDEVPPLIDFEDDEDEGGADETEDWDVVEDDAGDEGEDGDDVGDDELLADTAVVKESVSKVRPTFNLLLFINYKSSFDSFPLPSYDPPPLPSRHGEKHAQKPSSSRDSSHAMLPHDGTLPTI
jgi:hypothetical protein